MRVLRFGRGLCWLGLLFGLWGLFAGYLSGLCLGCHFLEAIYTAGSVNKLFLASVEGVAQRADFRVHCLDGRAGCQNRSAGAGDGGFSVVGRVNAFFHKDEKDKYISVM